MKLPLAVGAREQSVVVGTGARAVSTATDTVASAGGGGGGKVTPIKSGSGGTGSGDGGGGSGSVGGLPRRTTRPETGRTVASERRRGPGQVEEEGRGPKPVEERTPEERKKLQVQEEPQKVADQGPDRFRIIDDLSVLAQPHVKPIQSLAPDAQVGFRGSLARGFRHPGKGGTPFDPKDFDVDAFIVSDSLAARFPRGVRFRDGKRIPEIRAIQRSLDSSLRKLPSFSGLRKERFTFRIFTRAEIQKELRKGDSQIYFVPEI